MNDKLKIFSIFLLSISFGIIALIIINYLTFFITNESIIIRLFISIPIAIISFYFIFTYVKETLIKDLLFAFKIDIEKNEENKNHLKKLQNYFIILSITFIFLFFIILKKIYT
jgi:hypothetical protein